MIAGFQDFWEVFEADSQDSIARSGWSERWDVAGGVGSNKILIIVYIWNT